jgi:hypothetical protein
MPFLGYPIGCPPVDAQPCIGSVYRLVAASPINAGDFVSYFEQQPARNWADPCLARGLSICITYEAAVRLRKRIGALRGHKAAVAQLDASAGVIKKTTASPDHHTWWRDSGFEPVGAFAIVAQEML